MLQSFCFAIELGCLLGHHVLQYRSGSIKSGGGAVLVQVSIIIFNFSPFIMPQVFFTTGNLKYHIFFFNYFSSYNYINSNKTKPFHVSSFTPTSTCTRIYINSLTPYHSITPPSLTRLRATPMHLPISTIAILFPILRSCPQPPARRPSPVHVRISPCAPTRWSTPS